MKPTRIDLNDYVRTGEGANGASFNHKTDPTVMLKLYFRNGEGAVRELELAQKVYQIGIPTPEPGDLVTDGERIGIRFRRLSASASAGWRTRSRTHAPAATTPNKQKSWRASLPDCAKNSTPRTWTLRSSRA